ncbi:MAG TPA: undecaprenyl-diphosphate phosphatase [Candidatus Magasanikbacteria bacterium]|nr:undecaprenyl-diphosphate phosphatase [Candidatus Magasanikbacteria bacterium]
MTTIQSIFLGLVEGLTEFLPISSTGHLILVGKLLHVPTGEFVKSFEIIIQLGAILAVVVLYWQRIWGRWSIWFKIITAFIPTAILGLLFYSFIKRFLLGNEVVVLWALGLGGLAILLFEKFFKEKTTALDDLDSITYQQAVGIGLFQSLAMVPGVSRSAATIIGGLILGLKRKTIVEFSFLLAVPTMLAASGLDLLKSGLGFSRGEWILLILGFCTAFLSALAVIKIFLSFVQKRSFQVFGWYRLVLAWLFWMFRI